MVFPLRFMEDPFSMLIVRFLNGNISGFGKPPDKGIISGGAAASILVISLIREGCLPADTALMNLEYMAVLLLC